MRRDLRWLPRVREGHVRGEAINRSRPFLSKARVLESYGCFETVFDLTFFNQIHVISEEIARIVSTRE